MSFFMIDVEADGPIPGENDYSMISFGAVLVEGNLEKTFFGQMRPISLKWKPEALAVSGYTREQTLTFPAPEVVMPNFAAWVQEHTIDRPMFISDNNGFDYMFVTWYLEHFTGSNPFGHSSTNLGSLYKGVVRNMRDNFKHLRKTKHTHHPVDDARGNAEAFQTILAKYEFKQPKPKTK
jgi:hypothetical protein